MQENFEAHEPTSILKKYIEFVTQQYLYVESKYNPSSKYTFIIKQDSIIQSIKRVAMGHKRIYANGRIISTTVTDNLSVDVEIILVYEETAISDKDNDNTVFDNTVFNNSWVITQISDYKGFVYFNR